MKLTAIIACTGLLVTAISSAQSPPVNEPPARDQNAQGVAPQQGPPGGPGGPGAQGRRRGAGPQSFEGAMKQVERGFEGLEESPLDASSKDRDLELVQQVQMGLVGSKGLIPSVKMAPQAKAKYGDDTAKYQLDLRTQIIASIIDAIALENAILAGNQAGAKALVEKLHKQEHDSHEQFKREEDKPKGGQVAPPTAPVAK